MTFLFIITAYTWKMHQGLILGLWGSKKVNQPIILKPGHNPSFIMYCKNSSAKPRCPGTMWATADKFVPKSMGIRSILMRNSYTRLNLNLKFSRKWISGCTLNKGSIVFTLWGTSMNSCSLAMGSKRRQELLQNFKDDFKGSLKHSAKPFIPRGRDYKHHLKMNIQIRECSSPKKE